MRPNFPQRKSGENFFSTHPSAPGDGEGRLHEERADGRTTTGRGLGRRAPPLPGEQAERPTRMARHVDGESGRGASPRLGDGPPDVAGIVPGYPPAGGSPATRLPHLLRCRGPLRGFPRLAAHVHFADRPIGRVGEDGANAGAAFDGSIDAGPLRSRDPVGPGIGRGRFAAHRPRRPASRTASSSRDRNRWPRRRGQTGVKKP